MTMLDDDRLSVLLDLAGASFEVPAEGPGAIVARAQGTAPAADHADEEDALVGPAVGDPPHRRPVGGAISILRHHRTLSAVACLAVALLVAGSVAVLVTRPSARPHPSAAASHSPALAAGGPAATTTTVPSAAGVNGTAKGSTDHQAPNDQAPGPQSTRAGGLAYAASPPAHGSGPASPSTSALPPGAVGQSAKIEQTGAVGLRVPHGEIDHAMAQLSGLAAASGGFVASSQTESGTPTSRGPTAVMTLQIPVNDFATVLSAAQRLGTTTSLSTKATDVTGQDIDLQSRLAALQASRQQYLTIMARASTIGDVLAVQTQLDTIQGQIEQVQGQLNVLGSETSYSSLTFTLSEAGAAPAPAGPVPGSGIVGAWHDSVSGFLAGVDGTVRVGGPLLFALVCLGVAVAAGRTFWRRWQRRRL